MGLFGIIADTCFLGKPSSAFASFIFFDGAIWFSFNNVYSFCIYHLCDIGDFRKYPIFFQLGSLLARAFAHSATCSELRACLSVG